jgi:XTP/dITP diphosphohydrolase
VAESSRTERTAASDDARGGRGGELRELVLATSNRGKLADFELLFAGSGVGLVLPADVGVEMDVEETGTTFEENALLKARAIAAATKRSTLADDSGLAVYVLDGAPGVYSARYAGPQCDDHANNLKLLDALGGESDRRAAFVCVLALVVPVEGTGTKPLEMIAEGRCEGTVADRERGTNGFGYDAVFYRDDLGRTFGEASREEKNARSHRGAAVRTLLADLRRRGLVPG